MPKGQKSPGLYSVRCKLPWPMILSTEEEKVCRSAARWLAPALPISATARFMPFDKNQAISIASFTKDVLITQSCVQLSQPPPQGERAWKSQRLTDLGLCATGQRFTWCLERFHWLMHSWPLAKLKRREGSEGGRNMGETASAGAEAPHIAGSRHLHGKESLRLAWKNNNKRRELSVH